MKDFAEQLLIDAKYELESMHKSKMSLTERVKYERAMVRLTLLRKVIGHLKNPTP